MPVPSYLTQLDPLREDFEAWLDAQGAERQGLTNEWEVYRYRLNGKVHIIYFNKHARLTYCGDSMDHMALCLGLPPCKLDWPTRRWVQPGPNMQQISKRSDEFHQVRDGLLRYLGAHNAPDFTCPSTKHRSQSEDGGHPTADHCEDKPPWE